MNGRPRILALFGGTVLFGQERGNIEALAALRDQGCEVLCLISDAPWNTKVPRALDERGLAWRKVPYIHLRVRGNLLNLLVREPLAFVRANVRAFLIDREFRATHIHAMNVAYVVNFWIFLKLRWRKPVIFRVGDQPPDTGRWRFLWRISMRRVTAFVANCEFIRRSLAKAGVRGPIDLIYNIPTLRAEPQVPQEHAEEADPCQFIYVGQISEHKGIGILVDAVGHLADLHPDIRLMVVGRIDDSWIGDQWARYLRDRVQASGILRDRVAFTGLREDVPQLIGRAGTLVVPSTWEEPFPNVVMEAKQAGRPAIVFPRGGLPEMIQHGVDGLVCSDATQEALVEAMRVYLDRPELMHQHGLAAQRSLERFDIGGFAKRWLEVYEAAGSRRVTPLRTNGQ